MKNKVHLSQFRGMRLKLKDSFACKELPPFMNGLNPADFRLDRWQPVRTVDKIASNSLIERNLDWIKTKDDQVVYGIERWGALIPNEYTEWFAVIVIHPTILPSRLALSLAEEVMPIGFPKE